MYFGVRSWRASHLALITALRANNHLSGAIIYASVAILLAEEHQRDAVREPASSRRHIFVTGWADEGRLRPPPPDLFERAATTERSAPDA